MWAINSILEIIFPERPDYKIIRQITHADFEKFYQLHKNEHWIALSSIHESAVRAAIHENKFYKNETASFYLASLLQKYLTDNNKYNLIIPIPLSKEREKKRGYNQVSEVIKLVIKQYPELNFRDDILFKTKDTPPQTSLNRTDRLNNVYDAYSLNPKTADLLYDQHILLMDDVVTTGSTLKAAKQVLNKQHPASITCLALAH